MTVNDIIKLTNDNSGFISVLIFALSLLIAWVGGLFSELRKRPKFRIEIIRQCTFGTTFDLKKEFKGLPVTKTAIVMYFKITNVGKAPSSIGEIRVGYRKSDLNFGIFSRRNWINEWIAIDDFRMSLGNGDHTKVFPFLKQRNKLYPNQSDTFLEIGKTQNGVVYFEQEEAFGSWMPRINNDNKTINIQVEIKDAFGNHHYKTVDIDYVNSDYAFKFNPRFGQTEYLFPKQ
jgi:hypothetical protein